MSWSSMYENLQSAGTIFILGFPIYGQRRENQTGLKCNNKCENSMSV